MPIEGRTEIDDAKVKAAIERLRRALPLGGGMTPAFRTIGRIGKTESLLRFREQKAPDGTAWIPSQRVLDEGGQTLRLTRTLQRSITYIADHASAEIGTNVIYARIQHLGEGARTSSIFSALKAGQKTRRWSIPARPYLGFSEAGIVEVINAVNDHLGRAWQP